MDSDATSAMAAALPATQKSDPPTDTPGSQTLYWHVPVVTNVMSGHSNANAEVIILDSIIVIEVELNSNQASPPSKSSTRDTTYRLRPSKSVSKRVMIPAIKDHLVNLMSKYNIFLCPYIFERD